TQAGLNAQESQLRALLGSANLVEIDASALQATQDLWDTARKDDVIGKVSVLPADFAKVAEYLMTRSEKHSLQSHMVFQATGISTLRLRGETDTLEPEIIALRSFLSREAASFALLRRPDKLRPADAWGDPGDALPLMRAVKRQL